MPRRSNQVSNVRVEWVDARSIAPTDKDLSIMQVYGWIVSPDKQIVIVSKNGHHWQLPGGKPEPAETPTQTLYREAYEETGIDRATLRMAAPHMFGYRKVAESGREYLQVRYIVRINASSLPALSPAEDTSQDVADVVHHARWVSLPEAERRIPWLHGSEEYSAFQRALSD